MSQPLLSVVIVNYNTRDLLRACLNSLQVQTYPIEIIVVDNASPDASADMVRAEFPDVILLAHKENRWFCTGNNDGIERATGDYVLLLNPDTEVVPDALAKMMDFIVAHPEYAGVTARMHYPDRTPQRTCARKANYMYLLLNHTPLGMLLAPYKNRLNAHTWYADWQRDIDYDIEVVPGSCTLMRRNEICLDDDLLLYFPEDTLSYETDKPFRFIADAIITHHEKSATQSWNASRIYFRDMFIFTRKHFGWWQMSLLWILSRPIYYAMKWRASR